MKRNYKIMIFLLLALPLYIYFIFFAKGGLVGQLQYGGILLCVVMSFWIGHNTLEHNLIRLALIGTAVADTFLLWPSGQIIIGVAVFLVVQGLYAKHLQLHLQPGEKIRLLIIRLLITLLLVIIAWCVVTTQFNLLIFISMIYIAQLLSNIIMAMIQYKQNIFLPIAFVLFLLCDIIVGLNAMQPYFTTNLELVPVIGKILSSHYHLDWLFYYPSQVLIVLSLTH